MIEEKLILFPYFGGKYRHLDIIDTLTPEHECHVDCFAGSCSLTLSKARSKKEVINDLDPLIHNLLLVLQNPRMFKLLHKELLKTEVNSGEYFLYSEEIISMQKKDPTGLKGMLEGLIKKYGPIEMARIYYYIQRCGFKGRAISIDRSKVRSPGFKNAVEKLPKIHSRLQGVDIEKLWWRDLVEEYKKKANVWFYFDPPYHPETRNKSEQKRKVKEIIDDYHCELSNYHHNNLIAYVMREGRKGTRFLISGYEAKAYKNSLSLSWNKAVIPTVNNAHVAKQGESAPVSDDFLWFNYDMSEEKLAKLKKLLISRYVKTRIKLALQNGDKPAKILADLRGWNNKNTYDLKPFIFKTDKEIVAFLKQHVS